MQKMKRGNPPPCKYTIQTNVLEIRLPRARSIGLMSVYSNSGSTFWIDQDEGSQVGCGFDDDGQSDFVLIIQEV